MTTKLFLKSILSPGDALVMTAAIESLHQTYPLEYITDIKTAAMEIWENNPHITKLDENDPEIVKIPLPNDSENNLHYPLIHKSGSVHCSFLQGYVEDLANIIQRPLFLVTNRPHIYLSEDEKNWTDQIAQHYTNGRKIKFWLVNAGIKRDFTTKQWPIEYYQKVIDDTIGNIQWVQVGAAEHLHHPLRGVIDLTGRTDHRQLMRLVYHSQGGLGPVTYLQHLCAAFEKPYICLAGGREPITWINYPRQTTFHTIGQLDCCKSGGCWKSRVVPLKDGKDENDKLCNNPVLGYIRSVGKCMSIIRPEEIISVLRRAA